jgi:two-component system NarL family sensor kinase
MSVRSASRTRFGRVDAPAGESRTRSRNLHDERQPSSAGLAVRYAVTGLVSLLVVALVAAYAGRTMSTEMAIDAAARATALVGDLAVRPALDDAVLKGDPRAVAALDEVVRPRVITGSLVRVKIWDESGRILYSDEPRLRGEQFAFGADEREVLATGERHAELSDLTRPENRFEDHDVALLEVYERLTTPSGVPVLFEAYHRYEGITEEGRRTWTKFAPSLFGGLVLLALLQLPIAVALARRLRRTQCQRETLLRRVIEATDAERRRIAGDLHDGVVQDLAGVAFALGAVVRAGGAVNVAEVDGAAWRIRHAVRSLRSLLVEIYPPNLYAEGLEAALSDLLARLSPRGIEAELRVEVPVEVLAREQMELLYRVAQEGVRNVVVHADARRVVVTVGRAGDALVMTVADDGRGVPGAVPGRPGPLGLSSLGDTAKALGAVLELESVPGRGTVLRLEVRLG